MSRSSATPTSNASNSNAPPASPGKILGILTFVVVLILLAVVMIAYSNTQKHEIAETYGRRRGNGAADSVNGTTWLAISPSNSTSGGLWSK